MSEEPTAAYSGADNLEAMQEAVNYNRFIASLVLKHLPAGRMVVDFGAGNGTFSEFVRAAGVALTCVEPDNFLRDLLVAKGFATLPSLTGAPDASVDYIFSLNVLEHIHDDEAIIAEWARVLRPGGKVFVYVPAFRFLFGPMDRKVGHVRRYDRSELTTKLVRCSFKVERTSYADSLGMLASIAYNALPERNGALGTTSVKIYDRALFPLSCALDRIFGKLAGKNVWAIASKT